MGEHGKMDKTMRLERLELVDKSGRMLAVISAEYGVPLMARYGGNGKILSWLTFLVDGMVDVRQFHDAASTIMEGGQNGNNKLPID